MQTAQVAAHQAMQNITVRLIGAQLAMIILSVACLVSSVYAYYHFEGSLDVSFYIILIPFYVGIFFMVFVSPFIELCNDASHAKVDVCDLIFSMYGIKFVYSMIEKIFYSGLFFSTIYLAENYDVTDKDMNHSISQYVYALGIYVLINYARDFIGSFWELYYINGEFVSGNNVDCNLNKEAVKTLKLYRVYIFQRAPSGLSGNVGCCCDNWVNYSSMFNPLMLLVGIGLVQMSNVLTSDIITIADKMNYVTHNIWIAFWIGISFDMFTGIVFSCKMSDLFFAIVPMVGLIVMSSVGVLMITYFYNGMFTFLSGNSDYADFPLYITRVMGMLIGVQTVMMIMSAKALHEIKKVARQIGVV